MTRVEIYRTNKDITGFHVYGHSGFAEEGLDIVCASISSVVWMTVNGLLNVAKVKLDYTQEDGDVFCTVLEKSDAAKVLLESMEQFLKNLANDFGKHLEVIES